jgi:RNA polymerase sigma-70 factor (ECF subfamily)
MLVFASEREAARGEVALTGTDARTTADQILELADEELDRSYRLAGLILGNQFEAEDATQDALLRAWRSADSLRDGERFQAWFDRILVNVCRDRLQRRAGVRVVQIDDTAGFDASSDPFRAVLDRDEVMRAMASLNDDLRIVILLHYWSDLTLEGVAERVGWPVGTVKSRLNRALAMIRSRMESSRPEEVAR